VTTGQERKDRRVAVIAKQTEALTAAIRKSLPTPAELVGGWVPDKDAAADRVRAAKYVRSELFESDDVPDAVADGLYDGFSIGWEELGVGEDPDNGPDPRLGKLLSTVDTITAVTVAAVVVNIAARLVAGDEAGIYDGMTDAAQSTWDVEMTGAITAGTQQGCGTLGGSKVVLVADGNECEFCTSYDGRVMDTDHDSGMPPLHNGCGCWIDPLKE